MPNCNWRIGPIIDRLPTKESVVAVRRSLYSTWGIQIRHPLKEMWVEILVPARPDCNHPGNGIQKDRCSMTGKRTHRRIQDFVRGGKALLAPPGSAPDYLGEQFVVGGGGQGPLAPPPWIRAWNCIKTVHTSPSSSQWIPECAPCK